VANILEQEMSNFMALSARTGTETYGALKKYAYSQDAHCVPEVFHLILVLRLLLEGTADVIHETNWKDYAENNRLSTTLYLRLASSIAVTKIAEVAFDQSEEADVPFDQPCESLFIPRSSEGSIESVHIAEPFRMDKGNAMPQILALLHMAAAAGGKRILTEEREDGLMSFSVEVLGTGERTLTGYLRWIATREDRFYGNCILQLV